LKDICHPDHVSKESRKLISQGRDLVRLWRISFLDGLQWAVSFWAVILLDVDIGLYVGTAFSLLVLIFKSSRPKTYVLGSCQTAVDVFVPVKVYSYLSSRVRERPGVKVYQFCGPLHFSSKDFFRRDLLRKIEADTKFLVLDCSMVSYVDTAGLDALKQVAQQDLKGVRVLLASCATHVVDSMARDPVFFQVFEPTDLFVSVHDADLFDSIDCVYF